MRENVKLAEFTTLGIGGPARFFAEIHSENGLVEAINFAREQRLPWFVLGGGSNLLVADSGFDGMVIHLKMSGIEAEATAKDGLRIFRAEAGAGWDDFVRFAVAHDAAGVECLAGIPGTVGGTPVQNVGAYAQEVAETIVLVRAYDTRAGQFVELTREDCGFSYRASIFNGTERGRYIVTRVDYALKPGGAPLVAYKDLKQHFSEPTAKATLQEVSDAVREIRHGKGMLLVEGEADCRSAGSFFKNPIVPDATLAQIAHEMSTTVPSFPAEAGHVKIPAAWLVEQAGFHKGYKLGRAGISSRHTLALINTGDATAAEIIALRDLIVAKVAAKFNITLQQEPVMLGDGLQQ